MNYWLLKSEPSTFSIDDLRARPAATEPWDGVRNYQARNHLRAMRVGDRAFFYHSSCAVPGIVGIVRIVRAAYPDPSALDPEDDHYDPRSTPATPRWSAVDVRHERTFRDPLPLATLRAQPALAGMTILRKGNRLSVTPVTSDEWHAIVELADRIPR